MADTFEFDHEEARLRAAREGFDAHQRYEASLARRLSSPVMVYNAPIVSLHPPRFGRESTLRAIVESMGVPWEYYVAEEQKSVARDE